MGKPRGEKSQSSSRFTEENKERPKGNETMGNVEPPRMAKLMHQHSEPIKPQTSQGKNGRPMGEPEAFSDYSIIYSIMEKRSYKN